MSNHLGSTACIFPLMGVNNTPIAQQVTDAYGIPLTLQGAVDPQRSRTSFIGRDVDKESDLGAFGARLYSSEYGRFMAVDKMWEKYAGTTSYSYVRNRPTLALDFTGLDEWYSTEGKLLHSDAEKNGKFIIISLVQGENYSISRLISEGKAFAVPSSAELDKIEENVLSPANREENNDCTRKMREFGGILASNGEFYSTPPGTPVACGAKEVKLDMGPAMDRMNAASAEAKIVVHSHPNPNASHNGPKGSEFIASSLPTIPDDKLLLDAAVAPIGMILQPDNFLNKSNTKVVLYNNLSVNVATTRWSVLRKIAGD